MVFAQSSVLVLRGSATYSVLQTRKKGLQFEQQVCQTRSEQLVLGLRVPRQRETMILTRNDLRNVPVRTMVRIFTLEVQITDRQ
jgi:hypothetical protein